MKIAVCTLFEGSYQIGVAALANSLVRAGFTGEIFAGYKGQAPTIDFTGLELHGVRISFIQLQTTSHLTNYKPDFMLSVFSENKELSHVCYMDPDIVMTCEWAYVADWLTCGVALCEDVNSPLEQMHPRRVGWRRHLAREHRSMRNTTLAYVNGGFVGIARSDMSFLTVWHEVSKEMSFIIGGLESAKIRGGMAFASKGFANCFDCSDQDALNATLEISDAKISILGKQAMGFEAGEAVIPHALGPGKPWERSFLTYALRGIPPRYVDKVFLQNSIFPVQAFAASTVFRKKLAIASATLITRFWRK